MRTNNFVQDYAQKRQQQIDRAKQIREERLRQGTQPKSNSFGSSQPLHTRPTAAATTFPNHHSNALQHALENGSKGSSELSDVEEVLHLSPYYVPHSAANPQRLSDSDPAGFNATSLSSTMKVLQISEKDFQDATRAGIITPDQSRQLWAMLSNQVIRVAPPSSHGAGPKVHVTPSALQGLSHTSSLSSTMSSGGFSRFCQSITLDSLRESIRQFKASQRRGDGGLSARDVPPPSGLSERGEGGRTIKRGIGNDEEKVGGAGQRGSHRPEWDSDVGIAEENEVLPPSRPPVKTGGASKKAAEGGRGRKEREEEPVGRRTAPTRKQQAAPRADDASLYESPPNAAGGLEDMRVGAGQPCVGLDGAKPAKMEPLRECRVCGRTFRESIVQRHEAACKKVQKPRRAFDVRQQRLEGVEGIKEVQRQAAYQSRSSNAYERVEEKNKKMPKWKIQHQQFQAAMKAVRGISEPVGSGGPRGSGGAAAAMPPPPDDRVPCPHCGRKFAVETAERHIPHCANTVAKPKRLVRPAR